MNCMGRLVFLLQGFFRQAGNARSCEHCCWTPCPFPPLPCAGLSAMAHWNPLLHVQTWMLQKESSDPWGASPALASPLGQAFCRCESDASHGGVTVAGADGAVVIILFSIHVLKQLKITLEMTAQSVKNVFLALRKSPAMLVATRLSWFCRIRSDWDRSLH